VIQTLESFSDIKLVRVPTTGATIGAMRRDVEPFTDKRVRNALKAVQDRQQILDLAYLGRGDLGYDTHVSPRHPDFCPELVPAQDIEKAKALLAEAGYPDGIEVTLNVKPDPEWESIMAQVYQQQAEQAGIKVNIQTNPTSVFWDNWDKYDFALVQWEGGWPLGIMQMTGAYMCGVPWNETRMCEPEFDAMLAEASGVLDVDRRRALMCNIQEYHRENGGLLNPFFNHNTIAANKKVEGFDYSSTFIFHATTHLT
jgi:peptide/nickel transport system substrate-binding protein